MALCVALAERGESVPGIAQSGAEISAPPRVLVVCPWWQVATHLELRFARIATMWLRLPDAAALMGAGGRGREERAIARAEGEPFEPALVQEGLVRPSERGAFAWGTRARALSPGPRARDGELGSGRVRRGDSREGAWGRGVVRALAGERQGTSVVGRGGTSVR